MSNELTIKLSEIREWTANPALHVSLAEIIVLRLRQNTEPLGIVAERHAWKADILQNAPNEYVQMFGDHGGWIGGVGDKRFGGTAYRLRADVKVVDDTVKDGEKENDNATTT